MSWIRPLFIGSAITALIGLVALLALFQLLILTVGTLLCFVGLLGAAPLAACISTAAYRQLFKEEADQSVALSNAN